MMAFCPEHPKWDQNLKFTPLSETTSIPTHFICGVPPPTPPAGSAEERESTKWAEGPFENKSHRCQSFLSPYPSFAPYFFPSRRTPLSERLEQARINAIQTEVACQSCRVRIFLNNWSYFWQALSLQRSRGKIAIGIKKNDDSVI